MIRTATCVCFGLALLIFSPLVRAADLEAQEVKSSPETTRVAAAASTLAAVTGIAISPLLGTGVYGAYKYIAAPDEASRAALPWFAFPGFFIPALIIAGLCAAKDSFGVAFPPGMKKPLDAIELIENKISGLIAAGAVVPISLGALSKVLVGPSALLHSTLFPRDLAMITAASLDPAELIPVITVSSGIIVYGVVWMASHSINVLVLLSPWGAIDAALKVARTAVLGLVALTAQLDPRISGILCVLIVIAAYCVSGWAFRLTVFGAIFSWDFFTGRLDRISASVDRHAVFSSTVLLTERKVPMRTYGQLIKTETGRHRFRYRPWLIFPIRETEVGNDSTMKIGRGIFFSTVLADGRPLFILPPRYLGHEERIASFYRFAGVEDAGLRKVWSWFRETLGLQPATAGSL